MRSSHPHFDSSSSSILELEHEATILSLLGRHPNVVEFYGVCRQGGSSGNEGVHIVTKLEEGGSIADAIGFRGGGICRRVGHGSEYQGHVREGWARDIACG